MIPIYNIPYYKGNLYFCKERINAGYLEVAGVYAQKALSLNPKRPEALNLLGGISESSGNRREAEEYYRTAMLRDPHYAPPRRNLDRLTHSLYNREGIVWD